MWLALTGTEKKEQALLIRLVSLENNELAKRACSKLKVADLNVDDGVTKLLAALDSAFKVDKNDEDYANYLKFTNFRRKDSQDFIAYTLEFEHLYHRMTAGNTKMEMADSVLAFKFLDSANLSEEEQKLAFTAINNSELSLKNMKSALKRVFSNIQSDGSTSTGNVGFSDVDVKQEAFYVQQKRGGKKKVYFAAGSKAHSSGYKRSSGFSNKLNPRDKVTGEVTRCDNCDSKMHCRDDCPHPPTRHAVHIIENDEDVSGSDSSEETVNIVLMTEEFDKQEVLVVEASKAAVLDTACTKTVAGEKWYENYYNYLSDADKSKVSVQSSATSFRFGEVDTHCIL